MKKQIAIAVSIVFGLFLLLAGVKFLQIRLAMAAHGGMHMAPDAVTTGIAKADAWNDTFDAVGSLAPAQGATLAAEEPGKVIGIRFESGAQVNQGDILVELDTSVEKAEWDRAQANLTWMQKKFERAKSLRAQTAMSQQQLDEADSELRQARSQAESLKAIIERKTIIAPFSGRTGIRLVNVGDYLESGTKVVPLYTLNPLYLDFMVPQQYISQVQTGAKITITVDAHPGAEFHAEIAAFNPNVDTTSRNMRVRATVDNREEKLKPGMFVSALIVLPTTKNIVAVPVTAVAFAPFGDSVWIVEDIKGPDGKSLKAVRQQIVQTGEQRGNLVAITHGLNGNEEVVTSGTFKLRPGAPVQIHNELAPDASTKPVVQDT